jgi:glycosyltransferase involved in cell wall biosynthesis
MISLISTVLNEAKTIIPLLEGVAEQSQLPDEVIIIDGGSNDGTQSMVENFRNSRVKIKLIVAKGANRSEGRNIGIREAKNQIIAVTDGGVLLDHDWLKNITAPLLEDYSIDVVTGITYSMATSLIQKCFAAIIVLNKKEFENPNWFKKLYYKFIYRRRFNKTIPSSRSLALKKQIWKKAGGYPEHIKCSEDMVFNIALQRAKAKFELATNAIVFWTLENNIWSNFKYFYRNALWDGIANIFPLRSMLKIGVYTGSITFLFLGIIKSSVFLILLFFGLGLYISQPSLIAFNQTKNPAAFAMTPLFLLGKDICQNVGFIVGSLIRLMKFAKS